MAGPGRTRTDQQTAIQADDDDSTPIMTELPHELLVEILLRLPVKTLLRFRCVCKPWLYLISDGQFIKSHLRMSHHIDIDDDNCSRHRILFSDFDSCSPQSIYSHNYDDNTIEFEPMMEEPFRYDGEIIGSCEGLLCIYSDGAFYLWNPSLRKYKSLPHIHFPVDIPKGYNSRYYTYGFGYDHATDDYKLLRLMYLGNYNDHSSHTEVNVYTLSTNSWRRIEDYPYDNPSHLNGIFVSGALHWLSDRDNVNCFSPVITAFNLATATYTVVAQPSYEDSTCLNLVLGNLSGCLYVLTDDGHVRGRQKDLWIMKEYGVGNSWTKIARFSDLMYPNYYVFPMCLSKNDDLILLSGWTINLYNLKDDTFNFKSIVIDKFNHYSSRPALYIESLVSPKC